MTSIKDELRRAQSNESKDLRARLSVVEKERDKLRQQVSLIESIDKEMVVVPEWLAPKKTRASGHHATLCLLVTDTHFDENIDPDEVDGINCYTREIAEMRLQRCFERTIMLARTYLTGERYDGVELMLGGDIYSGNIHEELTRTNTDTLFGSLLHWIGPMIAGIGMLADAFKHVHVSGVPGNHGRMTRKPIHKQRAADNLDWLLYMLMAREMKSDARVTWNITKSADAHVQIYNSRFLLTHGDQFHGGSGIAGAMSPLLLGANRKTRRQAAAGRPYDIMVAGHWHQAIFLPSKGLMVGGALKGYDEYAFHHNYESEPPQQALWITTPEHGVTFSAPIFVQDKKREGW